MEQKPDQTPALATPLDNTTSVLRAYFSGYRPNTTRHYPLSPNAAETIIEAAATVARQSATIEEQARTIEAMQKALDDIGGLSRALRQGGPAPEDLQELSDALEEAVNTAHDTVALVQTEKADG